MRYLIVLMTFVASLSLLAGVENFSINYAPVNDDLNASPLTCGKMQQFEDFLKGNKEQFTEAANKTADLTNPCANIVYLKLVELVDQLSVKDEDIQKLIDQKADQEAIKEAKLNLSKKESYCNIADSFCNDAVSKENSQTFETIVVVDCNKGTNFIITRAECVKYSFN